MFRRQAKCRTCGFLGIRPDLPVAFGWPSEPLEQIKLLHELDLLRISECTQRGREHIANGTHADPAILTCTRHVWSSSDFKDEDKKEFLTILNTQRECTYFFSYSPGYSPSEHRELHREAKTQRLLIIGMLSAALIGALAAIVAQLITR